MAIYHMSIKIHSRSKGQSAVACAAYRSGEKLKDEETGRICDYRKKQGVVYSEILLSEHAPPEFSNREILWNSVMRCEKNSDAQFAREFELALPRELDRSTHIRLLHHFLEPLVREGMCIDFSIHDKGDGNPHCHALATMRPIKEDGSWGLKERKGYMLDDTGERIPIIDPETGLQKVDSRNRRQWKRGMVETTGWNKKENAERWRKEWEECCNMFLPDKDKVDHRSYLRQGVPQIATKHEGYEARQMEMEGRFSDRCEENRKIRNLNSLLRRLKQKICTLTQKLKQLKKTFYEIKETVYEQKDIGRQHRNRSHVPGSYGTSLTTAESDRGSIFSLAGTEGPERKYPGRTQASFPTAQRNEDRTGEMEGIITDTQRRKQLIAQAESGIAALGESIREVKRLNERYARLQRRRSTGSDGGDAERDRAKGRPNKGSGNPALPIEENGWRKRLRDPEVERIYHEFEQRERRRAKQAGRESEQTRARSQKGEITPAISERDLPESKQPIYHAPSRAR